MSERRRKFEQDFKEGAVRLVRETGKPIAQVARELGIHDGTLGNWVNVERRRRGQDNGGLGEDERAELVRLRRENALCRVRHKAFYADGRVMPRHRPEARLVLGAPLWERGITRVGVTGCRGRRSGCRVRGSGPG